jgi:hypothetical protein
MTDKRPQGGLPLTINFPLPAYWTPGEALAVFELIDDLREKIWEHYAVQLFEPAREDQQHVRTHPSDANIKSPDRSDPDF